MSLGSRWRGFTDWLFNMSPVWVDDKGRPVREPVSAPVAERRTAPRGRRKSDIKSSSIPSQDPWSPTP